MTVELRGFRELDNALRELPKSTGKNTLRRVAKGALQPMADKAISLAPFGEGDLKASIKVSEKRTKRVSRINRFDKNTGIQISMGPVSGNAVLNYATFVEFGTSDTSPKPYMRPAWDSGKEEALDYIRANLGLEIDKAAARLAKKTAKLAAKG